MVAACELNCSLNYLFSFKVHQHHVYALYNMFYFVKENFTKFCYTKFCLTLEINISSVN